MRASRCRYLLLPRPLSSSPRHLYKKSTSILEGGKSLDRNRPCINWPLQQLAPAPAGPAPAGPATATAGPSGDLPPSRWPDGLNLEWGKRTLPRVLFPPASSADFCWVTVCVGVEAGRKQVANKETLQPEIPNVLLPACFAAALQEASSGDSRCSDACQFMGEPTAAKQSSAPHTPHPLLCRTRACLLAQAVPFVVGREQRRHQAPLPLLGAAWAMEALAVANAQGLSLEPSTNAAGYRGVKITKRSRARPFQASPTSEPTSQGPSARRTLRTLRTLHTLHTLRTLTPDYPT